ETGNHNLAQKLPGFVILLDYSTLAFVSVHEDMAARIHGDSFITDAGRSSANGLKQLPTGIEDFNDAAEAAMLRRIDPAGRTDADLIHAAVCKPLYTRAAVREGQDCICKTTGRHQEPPVRMKSKTMRGMHP